jgi:murein L,D-transpeptidase YafK
VTRQRKILLSALAIFLVVGILFGYTKMMAKIGPGTPPMMAAPNLQADRIVVSKSDRLMYLLREGRVFKTYPIAMGKHWGQGRKQREGDERTPEGAYTIDWRNPKSKAYLSLHISYPNAEDQRQATQAGYAAGGNVIIHGLPNGWGAIGSLHRWVNWTDGCIGVTNDEMQEIWALVPTNTPIDIYSSWVL